MPKPSLNPDKARIGGGGIEAGNYEVVGAKFQNIKTDYKVNQLYTVLELATLDKDGDRVRGADPVELHLSFGEKAIEAFHPGKASGPNDPNPEDQGVGVDAEGNTIYCDEAAQFNASSGALVFQTSLVKQGFPKDILDMCWAPSFTGLKFHLETLDAKTCNERLGTRLNTKPTPDGGMITYKVATQWLNPNYLKNGVSNGASSGVSSAKTEAAAPQSAEDVAAECVRRVAAKKAGPKNAMKTPASIRGFLTNEFATGKFRGVKMSDVRVLFENDEWLMNQVTEAGGQLAFDDQGHWTGAVEFPAAG